MRKQQARREGDAGSERVQGTERDAENVAPALLYLCSEDGGNSSGRAIGASGYQITLYHDYEPERQIFWDSRWPIDKIFEVAPNTIFEGLTPPSGDRPSGAGGA